MLEDQLSWGRYVRHSTRDGAASNRWAWSSNHWPTACDRNWTRQRKISYKKKNYSVIYILRYLLSDHKNIILPTIDLRTKVQLIHRKESLIARHSQLQLLVVTMIDQSCKDKDWSVSICFISPDLLAPTGMSGIAAILYAKAEHRSEHRQKNYHLPAKHCEFRVPFCIDLRFGRTVLCLIRETQRTTKLSAQRAHVSSLHILYIVHIIQIYL